MLIKNARLIDEEIDYIGDIYIVDGLIKEVGKNLNIEIDNTIDLNGKIIMPAFVDTHTHFREPGFTYKEDLESGSNAAIRGGYTFANLMGNTKPIASNMEIVEYVENRIKEIGLMDVHQCISITKDFNGEDLSHLDEIDERVKCITDDGVGVLSNISMYNAMLKAKEKDIVVLSHPEDNQISKIDDRLSENLMTLRDLSLSERTGAKLHMAHISTKEIAEYIRIAKKKNQNLTCEVTPHHISLYDNDYKVNPPIREKADVLALIDAVKDGTIDTIGTDHAPHTEEDKKNGSPGISCIETAFPVVYTVLVKENGVSLNYFSKLMSANASRILKINKGRIAEGYDGDLVVLDLDTEITIDSSKFASKGKNTPFNGMKYFGRVLGTIKAGDLKYDGGLYD